MSGYDGRIAFEGDTARGKQLLARAIKHANVQQQNKNILGLSSSIKTYDLGGGAYCIAIDLAHMRALHIVAPFSSTTDYPVYDIETSEGTGGPGVYDVLAGFTIDQQIVKEKFPDAKGKLTTYDVLAKFEPTHRTAQRYKDATRRMRLAVEQNAIFVDVNDTSGNTWSEHKNVKPTNYSGMMRVVVQLVMGIGKTIRPTAEEALMPPLPHLPPSGHDLHFPKEVRTHTSAFGLYQRNPVPYVPRVDFDYRVSKTHGLCMDNDGIWWVIEIGHRGVHAMKLYMDPVSMTKEGLARYIRVSPELADPIKALGGLPLGITLPVFEMFGKFVRAGEVVELISSGEMSVFNSKAPMSSDTGWVFNLFGTEAHNTCWEYGLDEVKRCYHYSVGINLVNERFKPWTTARSTLAQGYTSLWEVNKCRRMTEDEAKQILKIFDRDGGEAGRKAFDELVVKPTLSGSARISLQRMGMAYHPAKFDFQPQIKYPEHIVGALLSFDFADGSYPRKRRYVKSQAPMYVTYINGQLDVVMYENDSRKKENQPPSNSTTREECQAVGGWTDTVLGEGPLEVQGAFYSNRWDERVERQNGSRTVTTHKGHKVTAYPMAGAEHFFACTYFAWTVVLCYTDSVAVAYPSAPSMSISVSAVLRDRCAYYYTTQDSQAPGSSYYSGEASSYEAADRDVWEIYHPILAWVGSMANWCPNPQDWIDKHGLDCTMRKRCIITSTTACFGDNEHQGFWGNACRPGPGWSYPFEGPGWTAVQPPSSYGYSGGKQKGTIKSVVRFINDTPLGETITKRLDEDYEEGSKLSEWWWRASPDEAGNMPTISATNSCVGEWPTNLMDDMNGDIRHLGGPEYMFTGWHGCYTGVIE